eukprot:PhF_6_TR22323/c0_g1_i2/m.31599
MRGNRNSNRGNSLYIIVGFFLCWFLLKSRSSPEAITSPQEDESDVEVIRIPRPKYSYKNQKIVEDDDESQNTVPPIATRGATTCRGWRQTGRCSPTGPRESSGDKPCSAWISDGSSGYCDCTDGKKALVGCNHESFTCEFVCRGGKFGDPRPPSTNEEDDGASQSKCVGWRQTGRCDPNGQREESYDRNCDALIADGLSGYCECANGRRTRGVTCEHGPFTCNVLCDEQREIAFMKTPYRRKRYISGPVVTLPPMSEEEKQLATAVRPNTIPMDADRFEQSVLDRLSKGVVPGRPIYEDNYLRYHLEDIKRRVAEAWTNPPLVYHS